MRPNDLRLGDRFRFTDDDRIDRLGIGRQHDWYGTRVAIHQELRRDSGTLRPIRKRRDLPIYWLCSEAHMVFCFMEGDDVEVIDDDEITERKREADGSVS